MYLTVAMIVTGSLVIGGKIVTQELPVALATFLRFGIATLIFTPVYFTLPKEQWPTNKEWQYLAGMAILGIFVYNHSLLNGLKLTSTANSAIILGSEPALTALIAFLLLKEKINFQTIVGIILASIGMMILQIMHSGGNFYGSLLGDLLIFISVWGGVSFNLFSKKLSKRLSPTANAAWLSLCGMLIFLPQGLWEAFNFNFATVSLKTWAALFYLAVFVTVLVFILWYEGLKGMKLQTVAVYTTLIPLSTLAMSVFILSEPLHLAHVIGAIFIVGAILLVSMPEKTIQRLSSKR